MKKKQIKSVFLLFVLVFRKKVVSLHHKPHNSIFMTALQLNAELYRAMGVIADDETLMTKVLKYVKKLAAKKEDPTLMTKEEFFARVDKAKEGPSYELLPDENLTDFLTRQG